MVVKLSIGKPPGPARTAYRKRADRNFTADYLKGAVTVFGGGKAMDDASNRYRQQKAIDRMIPSGKSGGTSSPGERPPGMMKLGGPKPAEADADGSHVRDVLSARGEHWSDAINRGVQAIKDFHDRGVAQGRRHGTGSDQAEGARYGNGVGASEAAKKILRPPGMMKLGGPVGEAAAGLTSRSPQNKQATFEPKSAVGKRAVRRGQQRQMMSGLGGAGPTPSGKAKAFALEDMAYRAHQHHDAMSQAGHSNVDPTGNKLKGWANPKTQEAAKRAQGKNYEPKE